MYIDWIYYKTSKGRKFHKACEYVHKVAEEIIETRKSALVWISWDIVLGKFRIKVIYGLFLELPYLNWFFTIQYP